MISQTVEKITASEKNAAEKIESAETIAKQIIGDAENKANEIRLNAEKNAKKESERLLQSNNITIHEIFEKSDKASSDEISELKTKIRAQKEKAIDMVIAKIIAK